MTSVAHHPVACDIAIIGGGPAGLAAACAIRRRCPHLRLQVFERGPTVPRKGADEAAGCRTVTAAHAGHAHQPTINSGVPTAFQVLA